MKILQRITSIVFAGAMMAIAFGCKSSSTIQYNHGTDFSRYHTFAVATPLLEGTMTDTTAPMRLEGAAREAAITALSAKGLTKARPSEADLLVKLHGDFMIIGPGPYSTTENRKLTIEILDNKKGEVIWSRWRGTRSSSAPNADRVRATIAQMLEPFPPR